MPVVACPKANSYTPSSANNEQAVMVPVMIAVRVVECSASLTMKNITASPAYSAAIRRAINPTEVVISTPQLVNI